MTEGLTITRMNGYLNTATDGTFSWTHLGGDYLTYLPTGKQIYQMHWMKDYKMDEPITGETKDAAIGFWEALGNAENVETQPIETQATDSGLCPRCDTYCYGDCTA